ncbi:GDSL-like Lipase/Acylhydrolase-domain-containing protein [Polychytrium aggregatum]|uniref:GDSL-like Lipase/Acylhydrolase-domain-containing protein n=1 Tax=Polychytrium aggregatum TaxID=110093 RepID=UPI0022FF1F34|nr:GDSL-like Lipase/Acylhydrolase-domain-containing protein [Polychytrium aggregatum]KAI9203298.1 GDSL-like Lipase/Acylhydrolase-domain-containing protein [Polychytrium aggregatum]
MKAALASICLLGLLLAGPSCAVPLAPARRSANASTSSSTSSSWSSSLYSNQNISNCQPLAPRAAPTSVHDLRADDIRVVAALGDSITAAFGADGRTPGQPLFIENLNENRGVSFFMGGDPGAITVANFVHNYKPSLTGSSYGTHVTELCYGLLCPPLQYHPVQDRLNAAQTGAMALNLQHELNYLINEMQQNSQVDMKNDFKLLNIFIGNNDACSGCDPISGSLWLSPDVFESAIRDILSQIQANIPRTVVNIVQQFNISQVWDLTHNDSYCSTIRSEGLTFECTCAFLPGELGTLTRQRMDDLIQEYNGRLYAIWKDYQAQTPDPSFAVVLDPSFTQITIGAWPIQMLSDVDCFHPSVRAHELMAVSMWNNLFRPFSNKTTQANPYNPGAIFCPSDDSRIMTN